MAKKVKKEKPEIIPISKEAEALLHQLAIMGIDVTHKPLITEKDINVFSKEERETFLDKESKVHAASISKAGPDSDINVEIGKPGEVKIENGVAAISQEALR